MPAAPCPMPTHMVTMPYFSLWRRSACTTVAERMAPVAPSGWPSAMAPPMGLTLAGSSPRVFITASDCAAKASFSSIQSSASCLRPAFFSAAGMASIGPMPMMCGGTPRAAKLTKRASGVRPKRLTAASLARINAPAPSLVWLLLPAVTLPRAANTGRSLARPSRLASGRGPSSMSTVRVLMIGSPVLRLAPRAVTSTGVISSLNSPAAMAATARWLDCRANASCASRDTPHCCATFSAVRPMP